MKRVETEYDEWGWKLIVKENKEEITEIYLRSRTGNHTFHKPFYLRLDKDKLKKLKKLLKEVKT